MEKVTFVQIGIGVGILVVFLQIASLINGLITSRQAQRREVAFETVYATKESVDGVVVRVNEVDAKVQALDQRIISNGEVRKQAIEAKVEAARQEAKAEASKLRDQISDVAKDVAEMKGETSIINQNVMRLTSSVDRIADRRLDK